MSKLKIAQGLFVFWMVLALVVAFVKPWLCAAVACQLPWIAMVIHRIKYSDVYLKLPDK